MTKVSVDCPQCTARYDVSESKLGRRARCAKCGNLFELRAPSPAPPGTEALEDASTFGSGDDFVFEQFAQTAEAGTAAATPVHTEQCPGCGGNVAPQDRYCGTCGYDRVQRRSAHREPVEPAYDRSAGGSRRDRVTRAALAEVASRQRWLIAVMGLQIPLYILVALTHSPVFGLPLLALGVAGAVLLIMLMGALNYNVVLIAFMFLLSMAPCLSIVILLIVNGMATSRLTRSGIPVGLFGASSDDIRALRRS